MLAKTIRADFSWIQFTPDLMPSDVIGTPVFNQQKSIFEFRKGPVFSNIVLIDEINRAPAKTQAALFEVMEEQQVTADGTTYVLSFPFLVVATQNPIEQEGTYKLPEAQLDRFLFRIRIGYPSEQEELQILQRFKQDLTTRVQETVSSVVSPDVLKQLRQVVESVTISDQLLQYIASPIHLTRNHPDLFLGASPRASLAIMRTSRAYAALQEETLLFRTIFIGLPTRCSTTASSSPRIKSWKESVPKMSSGKCWKSRGTTLIRFWQHITLRNRFSGGWGLIILYTVSFFIPFLYPVAIVAMLFFAALTLVDAALLFIVKQPLSVSRRLPQVMSLHDENEVHLHITGRFRQASACASLMSCNNCRSVTWNCSTGYLQELPES